MSQRELELISTIKIQEQEIKDLRGLLSKTTSLLMTGEIMRERLMLRAILSGAYQTRG
jgi:hypothetical protein